MKHLIILLSFGLMSPTLAETVSANDLFKRGEAALAQGDIERARLAYTQALKLDPTHGNAKYRLLSMRSLTKDARKKVRERKFASINLEAVIFEELTLEEALEGLSAMVEKTSNEIFIPNFVIDDPDQRVMNNRVNLRLKNIPAHVALKYVLAQAQAKEIWGEHVITIRPLADGTSKTITTKQSGLSK